MSKEGKNKIFISGCNDDRHGGFNKFSDCNTRIYIRIQNIPEAAAFIFLYLHHKRAKALQKTCLFTLIDVTKWLLRSGSNKSGE